MNNEIKNAKEHPEIYLNDNKGLIESIVNIFSFETSKFSREDLVQEANMSAIYAIQKYDETSSAALSTYIYSSVKRACRDFVRKNKHDLYVSSYQQNKNWKEAEAKYTEEDEKQTVQAKFATTESPMAIRSDTPIAFNTTGCDSIGSTIPSGDISVLDNLIKEEQVTIITEEIGRLSEREREIISARFWNKETLEEIATRQGCSRQRIYSINRRAMDKLTVKIKKRLEDELFV